jgi:hypothetical protein
LDLMPSSFQPPSLRSARVSTTAARDGRRVRHAPRPTRSRRWPCRAAVVSASPRRRRGAGRCLRAPRSPGTAPSRASGRRPASRAAGRAHRHRSRRVLLALATLSGPARPIQPRSFRHALRRRR